MTTTIRIQVTNKKNVRKPPLLARKNSIIIYWNPKTVPATQVYKKQSWGMIPKLWQLVWLLGTALGSLRTGISADGYQPRTVCHLPQETAAPVPEAGPPQRLAPAGLVEQLTEMGLHVMDASNILSLLVWSWHSTFWYLMKTFRLSGREVFQAFSRYLLKPTNLCLDWILRMGLEIFTKPPLMRFLF